MYRKVVWFMFVLSVAMFIAWCGASCSDHPTDPDWSVHDTIVVE